MASISIPGRFVGDWPRIGIRPAVDGRQQLDRQERHRRRNDLHAPERGEFVHGFGEFMRLHRAARRERGRVEIQHHRTFLQRIGQRVSGFVVEGVADVGIGTTLDTSAPGVGGVPLEAAMGVANSLRACRSFSRSAAFTNALS